MCTKRYKLFATCYDKRGRILSYGENSYSKSHPMMKYLAERVGVSEAKIYLHAEVQALLRAGDKQVHKLLVQRFDEQGKPALAKPCKICQEALKMHGCSILEYTTPIIEGNTRGYVKVALKS